MRNRSGDKRLPGFHNDAGGDPEPGVEVEPSGDDHPNHEDAALLQHNAAGSLRGNNRSDTDHNSAASGSDNTI